MKKSYVFLQGVRSPFFRRLGATLRVHGNDVLKINFTVGDTLSWSTGNSISYRGEMGRLSDFYADVFKRYGVTDVVLFGDCRPVHRPAIILAQSMGVRIHVYEEGYFRPSWITLERDGVNGNSRLSKDPNWYRVQAESIPSYGNGVPFESPFIVRASHDIMYNIGAGLNPVLYPGYSSHVPYSPISEYLNYIRRSARVALRSKRDRIIVNDLIGGSQFNPFYLLPLQLQSDAQIRHHSGFGDIESVISYVVESFANHAPDLSKLLIKNHPLDPGFCDYDRFIRRMEKDYHLEGRLEYIESGHLPSLLSSASGVVTVNSTVGGSALVHNRPTIALGRAVYDLPGLTFQSGLDFFWTEALAPDRELFRAFRNVVIHQTQVNGGFYCRPGINLAVANSLPSLIGHDS